MVCFFHIIVKHSSIHYYIIYKRYKSVCFAADVLNHIGVGSNVVRSLCVGQCEGLWMRNGQPRSTLFIYGHIMTTNQTTNMRLCLSLHDELYMIDLSQTLYFMADDHYTHVYYSSGARFMVPFGLSRIEERLALLAIRHPHPFKRLGRKHIVNLSALHHISVTKQILVLVAANGKNVNLQISKPVLRHLLAAVAEDCI